MRIPVALRQLYTTPGEAVQTTMTKTAVWDPLPEEREIAERLVEAASREYLRSKQRLAVFRGSRRPNGRQRVIARYFREMRGLVDSWLGTSWVPDPQVELIGRQQSGGLGSSSERTNASNSNAYITGLTYRHGCIRIKDEQRTSILPAIAHEYCHHIQREVVRSCNRRDAIILQSFNEEVVSLYESRKSIAPTDFAQQLHNLNAEIGMTKEMCCELRLRRHALDAFDFLSEGYARGVEMHVARRCAHKERDGWYVWNASWYAIPDLWRAYAAISVANGKRPSEEPLQESFAWLAQEIPDAQTALSHYAYGTYQLRRLAMEHGDAVYRDLPSILLGPDAAGRRRFLDRMRLDLETNVTTRTNPVL